MKKNLAIHLARLFIALLFFAQSIEAKIVPTNLKCEYLTDPQGIDIPDPRFYWQVSASENGQHQTAYHLVVAADLASLNEDRNSVFDTRKVDGGQTTHIVYKGQPLKSATTYYWKVMVWHRNQRASQWSAPGRFTTGLLQDADWQNANWIAWRPQDQWKNAWGKETAGTRAERGKFAELFWQQDDHVGAFGLSSEEPLPNGSFRGLPQKANVLQ